MDYEEAVSRLWRHHGLEGASDDHRSLLRYAAMAASSHNTQPWKFSVGKERVTILPDLTRRCPEVDPDDHHLYASLGCAAANLEEAASAAGMRAGTSFDESIPGVTVDLESGPAARSEMFEAIPSRQCTRTEYDGTAVSADELGRLEKAGSGSGVSVIILTGEDRKRQVAELVAEGNAAQIGDSAWVDELKEWIRFNGKDAVSTGDGLYSKTMGNPDVPAWLGKLILRFALTPGRQSAADRKGIMSSAGIAVFVSDADDREHWVEAGRCYERFALRATSLGIRNAFINQPVEVRKIRPQFASWLGVGDKRPDLVVRFGRGPEMPRSLRRPLARVIEGKVTAGV